MMIRKFPIVPTIVTLVCVVIMFGLGIWQLDRKNEKDIRLSQIETRKNTRPYHVEELLTLHSDPTKIEADIQDYPIFVEGKLLLNRMFFIDNKIHGGKPGYYLLLPLQLSSSQIVLLNFGWLRSKGMRGDFPTLPEELKKRDGEWIYNANGVVSFPSNNKLVTETNARYGEFPVLLQQIDIKEIAKHLKNVIDNQAIDTEFESLLPFVVNVGPDQNTEFVRNWQAVVMKPEKHLAYAVQWFGLGLAALTIYLLSLMKIFPPKRNNEI